MNISHTTKKALTVMALTLLCFIPTMFVLSIVNEREVRGNEVRENIAKEWGSAQEFLGPVLVLQYLESKIVDGRQVEQTKYLSVYPDREDLAVTLIPTEKTRGIFRIPVYTATITGTAQFQFSNHEALFGYGKDVDFEKAVFAFPITDVRSITPESLVSIDGTNANFLSGSGLISSGTPLDGVHIKADLRGKNESQLQFSITLNGNERFSFLPSGSITQVKIDSPWKSPSFSGAYLPTGSTVNEKGFVASWTISGLGRAFPAVVNSDMFDEGSMKKSVSSVELFSGVEQYQMVTRAIKYAILFILLTFMAFFFVEVLNALRVHPIQYVFIGASLALFYLLLLSLSEQLPFVFAYCIAVGMTTLLVTLYAHVILRARRFAFMIGGLLLALYAYLYFVLCSEDNALLLGTLLLFTALATVMFITRKVDWYSLEEK